MLGDDCNTELKGEQRRKLSVDAETEMGIVDTAPDASSGGVAGVNVWCWCWW